MTVCSLDRLACGQLADDINTACLQLTAASGSVQSAVRRVSYIQTAQFYVMKTFAVWFCATSGRVVSLRPAVANCLLLVRFFGFVESSY